MLPSKTLLLRNRFYELPFQDHTLRSRFYEFLFQDVPSKEPLKKRYFVGSAAR
jgi:hypothetical protein